MKQRSVWLEAGAVMAVALPLLLLMDAYVRDSPTPRNDELIYELMAQAPFDPHTFPFAHRVAVPTLVHLLPFSHTFSFSLLAWLSTAAVGGLAYVLMRRFAIAKPLAAGLAIGLALSPTLFVASLREGRNVDPESVLIMFAGALAIVDRRPAIFGAIVLVGCFVREAALFLVPFAYAVWAERLWDPRAARQTLLAAGPAVAAYAALRLSVPSLHRERVLGYDSLLGGRLEVLRKAAEQPLTILRRIGLAFGALWLAAPFALRDMRFARRGLVLLAACCVSMLFALDWGRIVFLAAPVIVVAAAWVLNTRPRLAIAAVAALLAMDAGYAIYMEDFGGADNITDPAPTRYPTV
ncbi:MAG TPA: hypothetical protein VHF88_09330 [Thermoleophilaceae bacterium]|nr:hypothetical protein [Thermoleophilaceae bacterium]